MSQKIKTGTLFIEERPNMKVMGTGPDGEVMERYSPDFKGDPGEDAVNFTSVAFVGDDLVFTKEDGTEVTLVGGAIDMKGDKGDIGVSIVSVAFSGNDMVFTRDDDSTIVLTDAKILLQGPTGEPGPTGKGIVSITKTGTVGLVDTYTILYSDETTSTFEVTRGADGTGDMEKVTYDPTNKEADAFFMENMTQGTNKLYVTPTEKSTWSGKQDTLVSGTNIKTVGGQSLLGSGDIEIAAGADVLQMQIFS